MKTWLVSLVGFLVGMSLSGAVVLAYDRVPAAVDGYWVVKVVNQDQFQGKWKQFKGDLKQRWGKFTDDDLMQIEGNWDKYEGKMQERYGDRREEVKRWTDEWFERYDNPPPPPPPSMNP